MEKEAQEISANIAVHSELEVNDQQRVRQRNVHHQKHLLQQIKFQEILKDHERQELKEELEMAEKEEYIHQLRVQQALLNPDLKKTHPRKLLAMHNIN